MIPIRAKFYLDNTFDLKASDNTGESSMELDDLLSGNENNENQQQQQSTSETVKKEIILDDEQIEDPNQVQNPNSNNEQLEDGDGEGDDNDDEFFNEGYDFDDDGDPDESEDDFNQQAPEPPKAPPPEIYNISDLAKYLRIEGFKFSVFNIKDTLIRFLEMFGERKVARHILDQDATSFYEIHANYVGGGPLYVLLTNLGFKPLHPTDLNEEYHKDMSYDVAMGNGKVFINVFGGLQQHAHNEETIIRNLYASEKKRYSGAMTASDLSAVHDTFSLNSRIMGAEEKISRNLMLASMQSHSLGKSELSTEFFKQAMESRGIDAFMTSLSHENTLDENTEYRTP